MINSKQLLIAFNSTKKMSLQARNYSKSKYFAKTNGKICVKMTCSKGRTPSFSETVVSLKMKIINGRIDKTFNEMYDVAKNLEFIQN